MNKPLTQPANLAAANFHLGMIGWPDISPGVAPKEPQAPVIFPRTVADRMAHEKVEAMHPVAIMPWLGELAKNLFHQSSRDSLIGVENKNPLVRRLRYR